ncbi:hypothetical protein SGRIM128S_07490 [Streptomyces griseomycini]
MPVGADLVEDHAADPHPRSQDANPCTSAATDRDCDDASTTSTTGARSSFATCAVDASSPSPGRPVVQPHHTLDDGEVTPPGAVREQRSDQLHQAVL